MAILVFSAFSSSFSIDLICGLGLPPCRFPWKVLFLSEPCGVLPFPFPHLWGIDPSFLGLQHLLVRWPSFLQLKQRFSSFLLCSS